MAPLVLSFGSAVAPDRAELDAAQMSSLGGLKALPSRPEA